MYVTLFLTPAGDVTTTPRAGQASLPMGGRVQTHGVVVCAQQCFLTCAHTHSVYVTCQPARKWNQTDARPGESLFLEGLISMEILIFFLPRKHWSSYSLSFV